MSRLADYFAVIGLPKAGSIGIYHFLNVICVWMSLPVFLMSHIDDLCGKIVFVLFSIFYHCDQLTFFVLVDKKELNGKVLQRFPSQDRKDFSFPEGIEMVRCRQVTGFK